MACVQQNFRIVEYLLNLGLEFKDGKGREPIHCASMTETGDTCLLEYLLEEYEVSDI